MSLEFSNNRRIAKNTVYLYIRMLITMVVSLYTSRVVLQTLGVEDFGVYNIIGGVVVLFAFLNSSMSNATQRFISYGIGKSDKEWLKTTFSMSMNCHLIIALILILLSETVGLWFVNTQLNIPEGRLEAAQWVYQFTILTFTVGILRIPYNATLISYERMSFYAYVSIIEVFLKLVIVFILVVSPIDKLVSYSALLFIVSVICFGIYYYYCKKHFEICDYHYVWDKGAYKELMGFSGWSMLSGGSNLVTQQGCNILINIYRGVVVNAAVGIANQVSSAIYGFVSNFQLAFQPQIVKLHAAGEREEQVKLMLRTSSLSYYLLLLICVPFFINTEFVINLWLGTVPEYSVAFCQWMLVFYLIDSTQGPLFMAIYATGDIKNYTIWLSALYLLNIPLSWIALLLGMSPVYVFIIRALINVVSSIIRLIYIKGFLKFPSAQFVKNLFLRLVPSTVVAFVISLLLKSCLNDGIVPFVITTTLSIIVTLIAIYALGLSKDERQYALSIIRARFLHK